MARESKNNLQRAGKDSRQYQINEVHITNGIEEKRAREIFAEMFDNARKELTAEAYDTACKRVTEFENRLIPKMQKIEGALNAFADPSFQFLITNADKTAAATDRPIDYDLLSELLIHRIEKGEDRNIIAGISRAVEIIDKVSDEALLGLTVCFTVENIVPISGSISAGLNTIDVPLGNICYEKLPSGMNWLDNLDMLNAIRINNLGSLKPLNAFYAEKFKGYSTAGISIHSDDYPRAVDLLASVSLPSNILVVNELDDEFVRIPMVNTANLDSIHYIRIDELSDGILHSLSDEQKDVLIKIFNMYTKDDSVHQRIINRFNEELSKRSNIHRIQEWWRNIPVSYRITSVGRIIAHCNARRCDSSFPEFQVT